MAIANVQNNTAVTLATTTAPTVTPTSGAANGNLLCLAISVFSATVHVTSVGHTNVTWAKPTSCQQFAPGAQADVELWYGVPSGTPGATITLNLSGSNPNAGSTAWFTEWSGVNMSTPVDQSTGNNGATGTSNNLAPLTPSQTGDLWILVGSTGNSTTSVVHGSFNEGGSFATTSGNFADAAYQIEAGADAITGTISTSGASGPWAGVVAAFNPVVAAGGANQPRWDNTGRWPGDGNWNQGAR